MKCWKKMNKAFSLNNILSRASSTNERVLPLDDAIKVAQLLERMDIFAARVANFAETLKNDSQIEMDDIRKKVRDIWYKDAAIIDQFMSSPEFESLDEQDKQTVTSWKQFRIEGRFICTKYFPEYAVLTCLDHQELQGVFFGVRAIAEDFERIFPIKPPFIIETALLAYKDFIIWDGIGRVADFACNRVQAKYFYEQSKKVRRDGQIVTKLS